ncbi:MAG: hypothetical protein Q9218_005900, partial [Villophora microphyllina]
MIKQSGELVLRPGLEYQHLRTVRREIESLNSKARINIIAPGWVQSPLSANQANDLDGLTVDFQATVLLNDVEDGPYVAANVAGVASQSVDDLPSGQYYSIECFMKGRVVKGRNERDGAVPITKRSKTVSTPSSISQPLLKQSKHRVRAALSVDFDAISAHLGTGKHPDNNMADYSQGIFAGKVGAPRLIKLFKKLGLAQTMTWFIPGHSMETFPAQVKQIVEAGCEIGLHGYSHEGAYQLTEGQEADVLEKCIELATHLTGKKPIGYRAPLYQLRESTIPLLEKHGFHY